MFISKSRVEKIGFVKQYIKNKRLCIGVPASSDNINKLGIDISNGETSVIPSPSLGSNCRKNAEGEWITDKTAEKERRYVNTIYWTWHQWAPGGGTEEQCDWRDVYRLCYPKKFIDPDCMEINLVSVSDKQFLASSIYVKNFEESTRLIKQTINMYLELFGCCYIYDNKFNFDATSVKKCQWEFLPAGEKIWVSEQVKKAKISNRRNRDDFFQHRIDVFQSHSPQQVYYGVKGFAGYYAFIFGEYCVFENGLYGNATYITTSENWEFLSQMTKRELLYSKNVIQRIIHDSSWDGKIDAFFRRIGK